MQLFVMVLQHKVFYDGGNDCLWTFLLFVTNNKTVTYFKDEVGVIIVPAHTVRCYIYRITNIKIKFDLHTEEKNRLTIHYQESTGIAFEASPSKSGPDLGGGPPGPWTPPQASGKLGWQLEMILVYRYLTLSIDKYHF